MPAPRTGQSATILLGCSETRVAVSVMELLQSWGYSLTAASNGRAALDYLESVDPPEIALLDMDLSAPTGVELVWEMRRRTEQRATWTILLSRVAGKDRLRTALECGCDDFLEWPADPLELKLRLRVAERVRTFQSQAQKHEAELHYQASHDRLTGFWNREALLSLIFQETDRVHRMKTDLCLMLMDLDGFSRVNQDYGYEAGDDVLTGLANRFRRQLRSYDLIGRCGEDEFLMALPGCDRQNALALAERIRTTLLSRPFAVGSDATTLTASFGVAVSRGRSPLVVLREAEHALAEAKAAGRNCARAHGPADARELSMLIPSSNPGWNADSDIDPLKSRAL